MASVVWKENAFRIRRPSWDGWRYLDRRGGHWWYSLNDYNEFASAEDAEAEYRRVRSRKIKNLKG